MILHIDFDAFYCGVEQRLDPSLRDVPFIVYQKNVIATLSYAARALGLKKLGLVSDALKQYPDIRLVNGESLARYREQGKLLYEFVRNLLGSSCPIERLGLEEMWIDLEPCVDYCYNRLKDVGLASYLEQQGPDYQVADDAEPVDLELSPTSQFVCDDFLFGLPPNCFVIPAPEPQSAPFGDLRLYIASHISWYIQQSIKLDMSYSCSVGLAINKTLAKMTGSVKKPAGLTVLATKDLDVIQKVFLDTRPVVSIPYFGRKSVRILKANLTQQNQDHQQEVDEHLTVGFVRRHFSSNDFLALFPGQGQRLWQLVQGVDETPVKDGAQHVQTVLSVEDTFRMGTITTMAHVERETTRLLASLFNQAATDLISDGQWTAQPESVRLTIRPFQVSKGVTSMGTRKSRSVKLPTFVMQLPAMTTKEHSAIAAQLYDQTVMPLFRGMTNGKIDLQLINVAFAGMSPSI